MYYITYDTSHNQNGAGAQLQQILSLFLIAKKYDLGYVHSHFFTKVNDFDKELLDRFNGLIELDEYNEKVFDERIYSGHFSDETISYMKQNPADKKKVVLVLPGAHSFIDSHPSLLDDLFPVKFSWIEEDLNDEIQIAFHIRRGDVKRTQHQERFVELSLYLECIRELMGVFEGRPHKVHIFSQNELLEELENADIDKNITLHIEEDVIETYKFLVNCDLLFAGMSSFSYSAAMLRRKGLVIYSPFWHNYPEKHLCVKSPSDIATNKEKILSMFP